MKITKDKIHPDLLPLPFAIKAGTYLFTKKFGFRLMDNIFKRMEGTITKGLENQGRYIKSNHGGFDCNRNFGL